MLYLLMCSCLTVLSLCLTVADGSTGGALPGRGDDDGLFAVALENKDTLRVSTLVMAGDISRRLGDDASINQAIDWCKRTGVTRVFLESFRNGHMADRDQLVRARDRFEAAGIEASGCVTTLGLNPRAVEGLVKDCYADPKTLKRLAEVFAYTAGIFDEIMIDDFFFTSCQCEQCTRDGGEGKWSEYRRGLMLAASKDHVLAPARAVNPKVRVIIKFPNWFDNLQKHGYDVDAQTRLFDAIWTGTETREPDNPKWGLVQQYRAFFIMRWLNAVGDGKNGGGWFDEIDTGPEAYIEQARQTVLGGAREMMLFNYASLNRPQRETHVELLRGELPELFRLARTIRDLPARGIAAVKPPNSDPGDEYAVYEFLGMVGLPLVPTTSLPTPGQARSIFLPRQAAGQESLARRMAGLTGMGARLLVTDGLVEDLGPDAVKPGPNVEVLTVGGDPQALRNLSDRRVADLRRFLLEPMGIELKGPRRVALYLLGRRYAALENFNDEPARMELAVAGVTSMTVDLALPVGAEIGCEFAGGKAAVTLPARSMALLQLGDENAWMPRGVFVSDQRIETLKIRIDNRTEPTYSAWGKLKARADGLLDARPHAPERWYVPGYYRDAEGHREAKGGLQKDADRSYMLALAWRMTGDDRYAAAALRLINAWPATVKEMQTRDDSRLSFSYHFPAMIFAADLLDACPLWQRGDREAFRRFVRDKALPMNTMEVHNNWGNWGLVLASACASYLHDRDLFDVCVQRWKAMIASQIAEDGHLPHEVTRNEGRHGIWYSHFSLMPQTLAAEILRLGGTDLYDYRSDNGRTLEMAYRKLIPWVAAPETFPYFKDDPDKLVGVGYYSYFELLNTRWPDAAAAALLKKARPMTAQHSAPVLTFTHGDLKDDAPQAR